MVRYEFRIEQPSQQYIQITAFFETNEEQLTVHLPAWRPGRYELGNFAKNVKGLKAFSDQNKVLSVRKSTKDAWVIETANSKSIRVEYQYFASELNAGSTYLSIQQLYVNPVNCCIYTSEQFNDPITLNLYIPESWEVASSMTQNGRNLFAENFDELADSPFMCSANLQHATYNSGETLFHMWFNGEVKPDWDKLIHDFKAFTDKQIEKFIEFPVAEYHFLFQILPTRAYHGVEHCKSTVILLGPSYDIFGGVYKDLLGVSSHELYHTWNVKAIRPIEMYPYDFKKENYSELGYICEGITTYMGDLFLLKSGVFNVKQYLDEFAAQFQKHFDNHGRFNYSVAQSSFDTWLDGYVPGAPGRKVSIYTEGCLLAFVTDVMLLRATNLKYGLDEVMKRLYFNYALQDKGVSEQDYRSELEHIAGISFAEFFDRYVHGTDSYETILTESLEYLGLELVHQPSKSYAAGRLGFKFAPSAQNATVAAIFPGSSAQLGGLMLGDEVVAVNSYLSGQDPDKWLNYFDSDQKRLTVNRSGKLIELLLPEVNRNFYSEYTISPPKEPNQQQKKAFEAWVK
ncbi:MAG: M61 family metallopeptidase [Flavobacteriia bacterium]